MTSHDLRITIERYPNEEGCSWGCPEMNLMGFVLLEDLFKEIHYKLNKMIGK